MTAPTDPVELSDAVVGQQVVVHIAPSYRGTCPECGVWASYVGELTYFDRDSLVIDDGRGRFHRLDRRIVTGVTWKVDL